MFWALTAAAAENKASGTETEKSDTADRNDSDIIAKLGQRIAKVWRKGKNEFYLPVYTWHNRFMYKAGTTQKYNELPWGAGVGKSHIDEDGDEHVLSAMIFLDSNYKLEPITSYAFIKNYYQNKANETSLGVGYSLNVTGRHEFYPVKIQGRSVPLYLPAPLPLPAFSFRYKQFSVLASYVPERWDHGNVLFLVCRYTFK